MKKFSARPKRLQPKSQDRSELCAPVELEAHLLAFGSTIGTYLLPKDEGNRPTDIRERSLSFFSGSARIFLRSTTGDPAGGY